ncbi:MAG: hypothetical protein JW915_10800 [Chitinispirillaceae bacterium]|nr:hypothetical protein [Chitinispirillaceae bacterium]
MYHDFKISGCITALAGLFLAVFPIKAQNNESINVSKYFGKKTTKNITIEETWNGSQWMNYTKKIISYDPGSNCLDEVNQKWSRSSWINDTRTLTSYDRLLLENAKVTFKWKKKGWEVIEGVRLYVDTVMNNGCRLVLHNCEWEPQKKIWIAEDSIFYDVQGRIKRHVSNDYDSPEQLRNDISAVTTSEYIYQGDDMWMETKITNHSDKKRIEKELFRYRKIAEAPLTIFMIDCWDERINRWIQNTARLYRKNKNRFSVYDSIEESINDQSVPVYVEDENRDFSGNLISQRIIVKKYDESKKNWSGTYYKWERVPSNSENEYNAAESTFTLNASDGNWILTSYEKKQCRHPLAGGYEECGFYDENLKTWEYYQTIDTLHSSGIILSKETFFDLRRKQWVPLTDYSYFRAGDSISVLKTWFDTDNNNWSNDSLFTIRTDASGAAISRTNLVWKQSGLFNERWDKVRKITYTRE